MTYADNPKVREAREALEDLAFALSNHDIPKPSRVRLAEYNAALDAYAAAVHEASRETDAEPDRTIAVDQNGFFLTTCPLPFASMQYEVNAEQAKSGERTFTIYHLYRHPAPRVEASRPHRRAVVRWRGMTPRIKQWWRDHAEYASGLPRDAWDELDAAIREDERLRLFGPDRVLDGLPVAAPVVTEAMVPPHDCFECGEGAPGYRIVPSMPDGEPEQVQCRACSIWLEGWTAALASGGAAGGTP